MHGAINITTFHVDQRFPAPTPSITCCRACLCSTCNTWRLPIMDVLQCTNVSTNAAHTGFMYMPTHAGLMPVQIQHL